ncbi:hypothetical protein HDU91_005848 [Kappamyces sp. JEL0680]|nr:hypothetical protein HDU91_005848 [Kappamyces sp. JEL0680]
MTETQLLDIKPAFYYEENGVPVFKPTLEEFKDFYRFVLSIEALGQRAGLVKVIPPPEWKGSASLERINEIKIAKPISQTFNEWFDLSEQPEYQPPLLNYQGKMVLHEIAKKRKRGKNGELDEPEGCSADVPKDTVLDGGKPRYLTCNNAPLSEEYLAALDRFYWRNLSFQETMYGADLPGSLFADDPDNKWNVAHLENLLSTVGADVPGVTTPYLYFGMYKATFAWHVEDMDLFSINYIHFGSPKYWYVVPPEHRVRFERFAAGLFYDEAKACPEFLRHKNCVISPTLVTSQNIPVHRLVQNSNEFVITFPSAYHQGFNTGFNCAESINFATPSWLEFARHAKFCECEHDSVRLDVKDLFGVDRVEATRRGRKPTQPRLPTNLAERMGAFAKGKKKALLKRKTPRLPALKCALCPLGDSEEFPLMPTDVPNVYAHVECAAHILETSIEILIKPQDDGEPNAPAENLETNSSVAEAGDITVADASCLDEPMMVEVAEAGDSTIRESPPVAPVPLLPKSKLPAPFRVLGIDKIPQDRWRLYPVHQKGLGACIQCTRGKCVRAYHVTCGMLAGLCVKLDDEGELESYCFTHDPVFREEKKRVKKEKLAQEGSQTFAVGTQVLVRFSGWLYEGAVTEVQTENDGCMVQFEDQ